MRVFFWRYFSVVKNQGHLIKKIVDQLFIAP